jgi:hypothetical protein
MLPPNFSKLKKVANPPERTTLCSDGSKQIAKQSVSRSSPRCQVQRIWCASKFSRGFANGSVLREHMDVEKDEGHESRDTQEEAAEVQARMNGPGVADSSCKKGRVGQNRKSNPTKD